MIQGCQSGAGCGEELLEREDALSREPPIGERRAPMMISFPWLNICGGTPIPGSLPSICWPWQPGWLSLRSGSHKVARFPERRPSSRKSGCLVRIYVQTWRVPTRHRARVTAVSPCLRLCTERKIAHTPVAPVGRRKVSGHTGSDMHSVGEGRCIRDPLAQAPVALLVQARQQTCRRSRMGASSCTRLSSQQRLGRERKMSSHMRSSGLFRGQV